MALQSTRREFLTWLAAGGGAALLPARAWACPGEQGDSSLSAFEPFAVPPAVGRMTRDSAVINLVSSNRTDAPLLVRARWRRVRGSGGAPDGVGPAVRVAAPWSRIELPLTGLSPGASYAYQVEVAAEGRSSVWEPLPVTGEFATQRPPGEAFEFLAIADAHWGNPEFRGWPHPRVWTALECMRQAAADGPFDFYVDLGDAAFIHALVSSAREATEVYLNYRRKMQQVHACMGGYMLLGNHEHEGGYHQRGNGDNRDPAWNELYPEQHHQAWGTRARLLCVPNPRGDTYPEGGEGAPGYDTATEWGAGDEPWNAHPGEPLQNFFAWTWGDALFVALDPFRYTLVGSPVVPTDPAQWTLGPTQLRWLKQTLAASRARWKFVLCHHLVGGFLREDGRAYGRGSAIEAARADTEQAQIHAALEANGVQFFLYGHDHAFCHSRYGQVNYICCPRPIALNNWWQDQSMRDSYGDLLIQGQDKPWIEALWNVLGYAKFRVTPETVTITVIRTGFSFRPGAGPIATARRDWRECWAGFAYPVTDGMRASVRLTPTDVDGVRTLAGARIPGYFRPPVGKNYYDDPDPPRPECYREPLVPVGALPETTAAVDTVPEVMFERSFDLSGN